MAGFALPVAAIAAAHKPTILAKNTTSSQTCISCDQTHMPFPGGPKPTAFLKTFILKGQSDDTTPNGPKGLIDFGARRAPQTGHADSTHTNPATPEGHAPIMVMGDHMHKAGEFMVSARHMSMRMKRQYKRHK